MYYYGPMMNGNDWGWGIFMMLFWFVFLVLVAYVILRVLKGHDHRHTDHNHRADPLDIAKERFAKGEITKEEFNELKKELAK